MSNIAAQHAEAEGTCSNIAKMKSKTAFILFPHQLFSDHALLADADEIILVEEYLFIRQYAFHKQKLILHRASMQYYKELLTEKYANVRYVDALSPEADIRNLIDKIAADGIKELHYYDVCDDWLEKRILSSAKRNHIALTKFSTPLFLNTLEDLKEYFEGRDRYFQTDFYIQQRKKRKLLVDFNNKPLHGKWSFDADNRKKYPKDQKPPVVQLPVKNAFQMDAERYVEEHFSTNPGSITAEIVYPCTHEQSELWMQQFFESRFHEFGVYEDAIVDSASFLHHSVLTPMLNIGLLLPGQVVSAAIAYSEENNVPFNSLEGFVRQIVGWREFIRGVYVYSGTRERTRNFWNFKQPVSKSFYSASTGVEPVDHTIQKVLATGYCHHIERLMILGNFMLLEEFHPNSVYQWFMEMFIDAYDWVMVPNIYGMSQFADGGLMATKPYISGSSYILKMSNYQKGSWCKLWDALFWSFMDRHRSFFLSNPRLGMLIGTYDKMSPEKKEELRMILDKRDFL